MYSTNKEYEGKKTRTRIALTMFPKGANSCLCDAGEASGASEAKSASKDERVSDALCCCPLES